MIFAVLPGEPPGSISAVAHLIVIGITILVAVGAIVFLTVLKDPVPDILTVIASGGVTYLIGVNVGAKSDGPKEPPK